MRIYPSAAAGDLARFVRTENLAYSSSRHHYGPRAAVYGNSTVSGNTRIEGLA